MADLIKLTRFKKLVGSDVYVVHPETEASQVLIGNSKLDDKITSIEESINTNLEASKSYADSAVAALVDSAPDALNTLNELAAALGNDANFSTTILNKISEKADADHNHDSVYAKKDHEHEVATESAAGFMSAAMVTKLNNVSSNSGKVFLSSTKPDNLTENDLWMEEILS